jgi:hypothetical protein
MWSREALHEQDREAWAQPRQRLEKRHVTKSDTDNSTQEKDRESCAFESYTEAKRPDREQGRGAGQPPEIGDHAAQNFGRAMATNGGDRK